MENMVTGYASRFVSLSPEHTLTTNNDMPFGLSKIKVINIGRQNKKITDTSVIKPEGGWQWFQTYLFDKLGKKDTTTFADTAQLTGNIEFEFSFDKTGSTHNITLLHAPDSVMASHAVNAIQESPK